MKRAAGPEAGMTLLETLISLFLIAVIATAGSGMLIQALRGAQMVEARGADAREIEAALAAIRHDLEAFTGRTARTGMGTETLTPFDGRASAASGRLFSFVRNGWADPGGAAGRSDLQRVEYAFEQGALIRRSWRSPDPGPATPVVEQRLLEGLEGLSVRYGRVSSWRGDWMADAGSGADALPDKLELTFRFNREDELTARFRLGLRQ
ncbi:type II secretion system minor pseudopilin GspJ [Hyphomonas sp.]|uniref:type II secretion system minor pseudopilin GspJ n=1 Tax=Hyphomonas sp. TaxID=87 RepID=UPI00391DCAE5